MRDQLLSALSQEDSQAIAQVANKRRRLAAGEMDTQALEATATLNDSDMQRRIAEHERQQARQAKDNQQAQADPEKQERTYINIPY